MEDCVRLIGWHGYRIMLKRDYSEALKCADAAMQRSVIEVVRRGGSVQAEKVGRQQLFSPV